MIAYICSNCRLRVAHGLQVSSRQRNWLSQSSRRGQHVLDALFGDAARERRIDHVEARPDDSARSSAQARAAGGRYSSRALRPQQLLDELEKPQSQSDRKRGERSQGHGTRRKDSGSPRDLLQSTAAGPVPPLSKLRRTLIRAAQADYGTSLDNDIWPLFLDVVQGPQGPLHIEQLSRDRNFRIALRKWSMRVGDAWLQRLPALLAAPPGAQQIPGPNLVQILQICAQFGNSFKTTAAQALWFVSRDLSESLSNDATSMDSFGNQTLRQLMGIWHLCMGCELRRFDTAHKSASQFVLNNIASPLAFDWSFLPAYKDVPRVVEEHSKKAHIAEDIAQAIPVLSGTPSNTNINLGAVRINGQQHHDSTSAAIVTLDLLQGIDRRLAGSDLIEEFRPWMELLAAIIKSIPNKRVPDALAERMTAELGQDLKKHYSRMIDRFHLTISEEPLVIHDHGTVDDFEGAISAATNNKESTTPAPPSEPETAVTPTKNASRTDQFTYLSIKRLGRSVEREDLKSAERVKQDVLTFGASHPDLQLPLQLYEHLMFSFLRLRRFDTALDCWNLMIQAGHKPTCKTYTVVIRYSQHLRNAEAIQFFWTKMREQRVQPDAYAWAARIYGLFSRSTAESAFQALIEMGQEWMAAARAANQSSAPAVKGRTKSSVSQVAPILDRFEGTINGVPKPDVYAMNSALGGLDRTTRSDLVPKILTWGRTFGIEPDIVTYNSLISLSMRNGTPGEALSIMRRMKERNIESNGETWTILLHAMFEGGVLDELSPQEQETKIMALIRSAEDGSHAIIDAKGYAVVLDRLMKWYNNSKAAQAVLAHMSSRGMEPTPHHYTILMTAYFAQSPPDFASIDNLWNRINEGETGYRVALDSQFYDRMIEGYATHHRSVGTAPMMAFLSRMEAEDKKPSWRAMECLARALAEKHEWERLVQIVDQMRRRLRTRAAGVTTTGQRGFWQFIISTGLLEREGITDPNQIHREHKGLERGPPQ